MTETIQRFLLKNTKFLQVLVNEKLAKRKGIFLKLKQRVDWKVFHLESNR
jgi:hypothetical protein